jgi:tRNA threonylcarbamoyl adenosine modification protein YeaZ
VDRFVAIETSNAPGSIALFEDARLLSYHEGSAENAQGESILAVLSQALEQAQWSKKTVKTWVVGRGPGSFTGIRVALATVQGVVMAGFGSAFGVTSFEALRANFLHLNPELCGTDLVCALPALPGEVYLSLANEEPRVCTYAELEEVCRSRPNCIVLGGGASSVSFADERIHSEGEFARSSAAALGYAYVGGVRGSCAPLYVAPPKITQPRTKQAR